MTMKRFLILLSLMFAGLMSQALAATISERVDVAHRRIEQGIQSGALTREEAGRLRGQFLQIRRDEARAKADGHLDRRERERLSQQLTQLEKNIYHLKHNDDTRGNHRGPGPRY